MTLKLFNTLSGKKEEFKPIAEEVRMYNCGPTVYDYAHIGNFRSFMLGDILRRYLEYLGYSVKQIMNITDVGHMTNDDEEGEDKMEIAAKKEKKDPWQIADMYAKKFFEDVKTLNLKKPASYPKATDHIKEMIDIIEKLIDKGIAYEVNGSIYYDVTKFPEYGKLSKNKLEDLKAGARLEINEDKKNPYDFALWVQDSSHIMQWDSPWGRGYPGWHIECSAMAMKHLGESIDIHTGGVDNKFPHHECEIAQTEGVTGKPFSNFWLHCAHLMVDGAKMSKSKGNFYTLRDLTAKHDPRAIRYLLLSAHYHVQLNLTDKSLEAALQAVRRIDDFMSRVESANGDDVDVAQIIKKAKTDFEKSMDDDLNVPGGLSAIFDMIKVVNKLIDDGKVSKENGDVIAKQMLNFDKVIGIIEMKKEVDITDEEKTLIDKREKARSDKNYAEADRLRDELLKRGIVLEDSPDGVKWKKE